MPSSMQSVMDYFFTSMHSWFQAISAPNLAVGGVRRLRRRRSPFVQYLSQRARHVSHRTSFSAMVDSLAALMLGIIKNVLCVTLQKILIPTLCLSTLLGHCKNSRGAGRPAQKSFNVAWKSLSTILISSPHFEQQGGWNRFKHPAKRPMARAMPLRERISFFRTQGGQTDTYHSSTEYPVDSSSRTLHQG